MTFRSLECVPVQTWQFISLEACYCTQPPLIVTDWLISIACDINPSAPPLDWLIGATRWFCTRPCVQWDCGVPSGTGRTGTKGHMAPHPAAHIFSMTLAKRRQGGLLSIVYVGFSFHGSSLPVHPEPPPASSLYNWWVVKQRYESHPVHLESALKALKRCLVVTGNERCGREGWRHRGREKKESEGENEWLIRGETRYRPS